MSRRSIDRRCELLLAILVVGLAAATAGCGGDDGPELIDVYGTVTLDGEPLPDAIVRFIPERTGMQGAENVRPATGVTDSGGDYYLEYSTSRTGALPGKYRVSITTAREPDVDDEGNDVPGTPERVPNVYNANTTLTVAVTPDGGPYDFELRSDAGEVVQYPGGEEFGSEDVD